MAGIRASNTKPELAIRKMLHALGYRYRLHARDVPGKPDLVLPRYRAAIFINGCFWHGHDCPLFKIPGTRREFWKSKIARNMARDHTVREQLDAEGWRYLTVWECAIRGAGKLGIDETVQRIVNWLPTAQHERDIRAPRRRPAG